MLQGQKSGGTALDELSSTSRIEHGLPQWFADAQAEARQEFAAEPYPSRKDEFWRFSSVKNLDEVASLALGDTPIRRHADTPTRHGPALERGFPQPAGRIV